MFEVYKCLYEVATAYCLEGGIVNTVIGCIFFALAIWYLMHLINIPFYLKEIARNTRRGR